jgi:hypothetical protein
MGHSGVSDLSDLQPDPTDPFTCICSSFPIGIDDQLESGRWPCLVDLGRLYITKSHRGDFNNLIQFAREMGN